jgi:protein tyrosine/serine phosphatase
MTWDGAFNLADLGGLATTSGSATVANRVFRSGRPETISSRGWAEARAVGVVARVDLRNDDEKARIEGDAPGRADGIVVHSTPTEDPSDAEYRAVCGPYLDHPRSWADTMRFFPERFAAVFEAIDRTDGAVLVHCAGGKDRTGLVTAMLLSVNGVTNDAITDDYERAYRMAAPVIDGTSGPELDTRVEERRIALYEWLATTDVASYLVSSGVDRDAVERLSCRLLAAPK